MFRVTSSRALASLQLALLVLSSAPAARADGSFPDARELLLPAARPQQIIVGTNFGLIFSEDDGATWLFSCEQSLGAYANRYALAPPPSSRLFALSSSGLIYSDDDSCRWNTGRGSLTDVLPYNLAVDPSDSDRVYVIGAPRDNLHGSESIYLSVDGGLTFGDPVFSAPERSALLGVLATPARDGKLFASMFSSPENHPILLRSDDRGEHWTEVADLVDSLGENPFELLAIDKNDPSTIFIRVLGPSSESLAVSRDGGSTFVVALAIAGKLNAFIQLESGTLLLGGEVGTEPVGYRSNDRGESFEPWIGAPRVHALAERNGKLYVAADNFLDDYVVGRSDNEGVDIEPLGGFADMSAVKSCVAAVCASSCEYNANINLWPAAVCGEETEPSGTGGASGGAGATDPTDPIGGSEDSAGAPSMGPNATEGGHGGDSEAPPRRRAGEDGCGACTLGRHAPLRWWSWGLLVATLVGRRARRDAHGSRSKS
jgi:hypothetical protein